MTEPSRSPGVDAYIASFPLEVQAVLQTVRSTIRKVALAAEERLSYRMPTFFLGRVLIHYAAFKKHIGEAERDPVG